MLTLLSAGLVALLLAVGALLAAGSGAPAQADDLQPTAAPSGSGGDPDPTTSAPSSSAPTTPTDPSPTDDPSPTGEPSPSPTETPSAPEGTDGMPSQSALDLPSTAPGAGGNVGWGDLGGGSAARPYVRSLQVDNRGTVVAPIEGGTTTTADAAPGAVTAVVAPVNLCRAGQTPTPGVCYATPNRVALTVGYGVQPGVLGYNFANPSVPLAVPVDSGTVIDLTVALNTLGRSLRWTWVNGDLLYWQTSNLGTPDATLHVRFRPATSPWVRVFPDHNGCTATPIWNCQVPRADGDLLTASLVFSLDDTLDPALTGAIFATQNAISGYLTPGGARDAPTLNVQAASTHLRADGGAQTGTVQAFIPAAALINLYGVLPLDAGTTFAATRAGDAGTNGPPTFAPWTAAANGSDGLLVTVGGITFSTPTYRVTRKLGVTRTTARVTRGRSRLTTVSAKVAGCTRRAACLVGLYDLGTVAARYRITSRPLVTNRKVVGPAVTVSVPTARLGRGHRYLLVLHTTRHKVLVSSVGSVP